jgi:very-short-patch-repair endonuclease
MRTLVDLAGCEPEDDLERMLDDAHRRRLIDIERFEAYLATPFNRARSGTGPLREMVRFRDPNRAIESDLETALFRALRRFGLPLPVKQQWVRTRVGPRRIDFAYPKERIAIELDGFAAHSSWSAFEHDRVRQNELEELGWSVRRFTWTQVQNDPIGAAVTMGIALGLMPVRWKRL